MALAQGAKQFGNRRPGGSVAPRQAGKSSSGARIGASMTEVFEEQNRSRLFIFGGAAVALLLVGWTYLTLFSTQSIENKVLTSPEQCASFGSVGIDECRELWRQGLVQHANTAPVYETAAACERNHGQGRCVAASRSTIADRQGKFIPGMVAIMPVNSSHGWTVTPLYRDPGDGPEQWRQVIS